MKQNNLKSNSANTPATTDGGESIVLDENLEISDADALLEQLQAIMTTSNSVIMDGSQVKVIDTAILQLLVAWFRQAQQHGTRISWQQPSDTLCNTAALLGLEMHLCLASTGT
ncbi:MAG: STAS domain-containing protein [Thiogranum sp.]